MNCPLGLATSNNSFISVIFFNLIYFVILVYFDKRSSFTSYNAFETTVEKRTPEQIALLGSRPLHLKSKQN